MKTKTFFASDLHFSHKNILLYEPQRVIETAKYMCDLQQIYDETRAEIINHYVETVNHAFELQQTEYIKEFLHWHNEMLIDRWNSVVGEDDIVYFLGDLGFGNLNDIATYSKRLNGHKCIILGNHDKRKHTSDGAIVYNEDVELQYKDCGFERVEFNPIILKGYFFLCHEPRSYWPKNIPWMMVYGHVHSSPLYQDKTENSVCACLDRYNYYPIQIREYDKCNPTQTEGE